MKDINWFKSICAANGLFLSETQIFLFETYRQLLLEANKVVNLISRKDEENFYLNHALNSVSFLFKHKLEQGASLLDLGTGGGFPGVPVQILYGRMRLCFLDSIAKKTAALRSILDGLSLTTAEVVTGRAEEIAKKREYQGRFDYVISRAAGKLDEVAKWSHGFLRSFEAAEGDCIPKGSLIVLKGGLFDDELRHTRNLKSVGEASVIEITFQGMDEIYNKEKKLVLVTYK